jgi:hypothetical protein
MVVECSQRAGAISKSHRGSISGVDHPVARNIQHDRCVSIIIHLPTHCLNIKAEVIDVSPHGGECSESWRGQIPKVRLVVVSGVTWLVPVCRAVSTVRVAKEPAVFHAIGPDEKVAFK